MHSYMNKAELSRCFGVSQVTVYKRVAGIEAEMEKGRYNRYAIADGLVSTAVFADYCKYQKRLNDRNLRRTVPAFNIQEAQSYLMELEGKTPVEPGIADQSMVQEYIKLRDEEDRYWKRYVHESRNDLSSRISREMYAEIRERYVRAALALADKAAEVVERGNHQKERRA